MTIRHSLVALSWPNLKTDQDKTVLDRQIATVDRQLDQLVYELYGLTDTEIALIEEATSR